MYIPGIFILVFFIGLALGFNNLFNLIINITVLFPIMCIIKLYETIYGKILASIILFPLNLLIFIGTIGRISGTIEKHGYKRSFKKFYMFISIYKTALKRIIDPYKLFFNSKV